MLRCCQLCFSIFSSSSSPLNTLSPFVTKANASDGNFAGFSTMLVLALTLANFLNASKKLKKRRYFKHLQNAINWLTFSQLLQRHVFAEKSHRRRFELFEAGGCYVFVKWMHEMTHYAYKYPISPVDFGLLNHVIVIQVT